MNAGFRLSLARRIKKAEADTARWKRLRKHPLFKQLHIRRQRRYHLAGSLEFHQRRVDEINAKLIRNGRELAKLEAQWKEVRKTIGEGKS